AIYLWPVARANLGGAQDVFCALGSATLQGCPWSGALWAIGAGPLIGDMRARTWRRSGGMIGACAGDAVCAMPSLTMWRPMGQASDAAEILARLALKTAECKIIPLAEASSPPPESGARGALAEFVSKWQGVAITDAAEHLGALMGPCVGDAMRWQKVIAGWQRVPDLVAD
ncbi:unnamed protein product, partial [Prorocentrum cordatum]